MQLSPPRPQDPVIAVLIPCYNEGLTIAKVVQDFSAALPAASIHVYDNNSTDDTRAQAEQAGAIVHVERMQGKGNVIRRMFSCVEADVYVLVDGDDTYDAASAPGMVDTLWREDYAMVVGDRVHTQAEAYRAGHVLGNRIFTSTIARLFGRQFNDILSGYRVFSRAFVKSYPAFATGFETETELTVHALNLRLPVTSVPTPYQARPEGSASKLHTYRDGLRILMQIVRLLKNERPLAFFSLLGGVMAAASLLLAYPILVEFIETGLVPRFPTAILATGMAISAIVLVACGLILDNVTQGRREMKLLSYLAVHTGQDRFRTAYATGALQSASPVRPRQFQ
jgi:glycosyltransferase involved in cell wall biosynthesis